MSSSLSNFPMPTLCCLALANLLPCGYRITKRPSKISKIPNLSSPLSFSIKKQLHPIALALPRRLILPAASAIWDAITGGSPSRDAVAAVRRGMLLFRQVRCALAASLPLNVIQRLNFLILLFLLFSLTKFC